MSVCNKRRASHDVILSTFGCEAVLGLFLATDAPEIVVMRNDPKKEQEISQRDIFRRWDIVLSSIRFEVKNVIFIDDRNVFDMIKTSH